MSSNHLNSNIKYKHIYKVRETKNNFYIYINKNVYFNIKKDKLIEDNIIFLRNLK
jgi:hypothetical protein